MLQEVLNFLSNVPALVRCTNQRCHRFVYGHSVRTEINSDDDKREDNTILVVLGTEVVEARIAVMHRNVTFQLMIK